MGKTLFTFFDIYKCKIKCIFCVSLSIIHIDSKIFPYKTMNSLVQHVDYDLENEVITFCFKMKIHIMFGKNNPLQAASHLHSISIFDLFFELWKIYFYIRMECLFLWITCYSKCFFSRALHSNAEYRNVESVINHTTHYMVLVPYSWLPRTYISKYFKPFDIILMIRIMHAVLRQIS